jgi:hypothetical protein
LENVLWASAVVARYGLQQMILQLSQLERAMSLEEEGLEGL